MSDTHAWPPAPAAAAVMAELAAYRERLRELAGMHAADDPRRAAFEAAALAHEHTEWQIQRILAEPARVSARSGRRGNVGEDTRAWLAGQSPAMPRNRGHL